MKLALSLIACVASIALAACGDNAPEAPLSDSGPSAPQAPAAALSTPETAAEPPSNEAAASESTNAAAQLSEVDDELETSGDRAPSASTLPIRMATAAAPATSGKYAEGEHYKTLVPAQPTDAGPDQVEVVEVFWYGCGHCYALDPAVESWHDKTKPGYVEFRRLPATWNDTLRLHARMFYAAEALGKLEELHPVIFREMHVNGNMLNTPDRIRELFVDHGVSGADFDKTFASFAVETKMQRADLLNRRYRVTSVPMVVVNGKYTTDVGSAGGTDRLFELVNELAAHEQGAG